MATLNVNEKAVLKLFPCLTPNPRGGDQWDASLYLNGINYQVELKAKDESDKLTWNSNKTDIPMLACWEKQRDFYFYSEYNKPNTPTLANEHYIVFREPILNNPTSRNLFPGTIAIGMREQYKMWEEIIRRGEYAGDLGYNRWLEAKNDLLELYKDRPDLSEWVLGLDRAEKKVTRINAKMRWHYISEGGWRVRTCQDIMDAVAHQVKTYGSLK